MIQHHILRTNIIRIVWQTVRRLTNDILEVKGFKRPCLCFFFSYIFIFPYYHKLPLFQPMSRFIPEFVYGVANGKSYTEKLCGVKINC